jgi:biopolymer transport protein ExbB/TolQ
MMSLAADKFRSLTVSCLLGVFVLGLVAAMTVATPSTALAQGEGEEEKPAEKTKVNPIVHFFVSIGIVFGLIFAAISVGMVALIIILLLDLRLGEAVPTSFVEEFTEMVNKRQFKQAYELCRTETSFLARVLTAGMGRLQYGIEDAREAMSMMNDSVRAGKDSWISYLGIIGTLGPLLGLVGTVSGMIGAFRKLGESTKAPDASELAGVGWNWLDLARRRENFRGHARLLKSRLIPHDSSITLRLSLEGVPDRICASPSCQPDARAKPGHSATLETIHHDISPTLDTLTGFEISPARAADPADSSFHIVGPLMLRRCVRRLEKHGGCANAP